MTKLEREIRRREQRRLADLNRNDHGIFQGMLRITLIALSAGYDIEFVRREKE